MAKKKIDVKEIVTEQIIQAMERGVLPWQIPWATNGKAVNHTTKKAYRGINQLALSLKAHENGWVNRWGSFKMLSGAGYKIRKGEKSTPIVYFSKKKKKELDEDGNEQYYYLLLYSNVFSLSQCENNDWVEPTDSKEFNPIEEAEKILANMPNKPRIEHGQTGAWYMPRRDLVGVPNKEDFTEEGNYYATLFHELAHSTGHETRLNREGVIGTSRFGDLDYSHEELVAEFASAFTCAEAGIDNTIEQSASYIASWHSKLKNDRNALYKAIGEAQKASDYILGDIEIDDDTGGDENQGVIKILQNPT